MNNSTPVFNRRNFSTMSSPVPGPLFHFVPPVFFLLGESLQSELSPLSRLPLFLPVVCFVDPSNSSEWNSQVLVGAGSSLMLCSVRRTPFRVSLHPAARRCHLLLLWSSDADLTSEVIKAFPRFPPSFLCITGPFFVLLCSYGGCRDDEYANRCTNMQIIQRFSTSTIILDDRETRNHLDETHSSVHFLQRAIYSVYNRREKQTVCRLLLWLTVPFDRWNQEICSSTFSDDLFFLNKFIFRTFQLWNQLSYWNSNRGLNSGAASENGCFMVGCRLAGWKSPDTTESRSPPDINEKLRLDAFPQQLFEILWNIYFISHNLLTI